MATLTKKRKHWGKVALVVVAGIAGYDWLRGRTSVPMPGGRGGSKLRGSTKPSAGTVY
jgi:hypothetical protein